MCAPQCHCYTYFLAADSDALPQYLVGRGTIPVITNNPTRKRRHPFDARAYRNRNVIERMFCRLKDWRRIATRYDKLATNFNAAFHVAAIVIWWANCVWSLAVGYR